MLNAILFLGLSAAVGWLFPWELAKAIFKFLALWLGFSAVILGLIILIGSLDLWRSSPARRADWESGWYLPKPCGSEGFYSQGC